MCALTEGPSRATARSASHELSCTFLASIFRTSRGALEIPGALRTLPVPHLAGLWSVASHFREGIAGSAA